MTLLLLLLLLLMFLLSWRAMAKKGRRWTGRLPLRLLPFAAQAHHHHPPLKRVFSPQPSSVRQHWHRRQQQRRPVSRQTPQMNARGTPPLCATPRVGWM